jgi:hypothetical protein
MSNTLLLLLSLLSLLQAFYTNNQARQCLDSVGKDLKCYNELVQCFNDEDCSKEYKIYEKCRIDEDDQIFNGFCFKGWKDQAGKTA